MFHVSCFGIWGRHDIWTSEKLKYYYLKKVTKRTFGSKILKKILALKALYNRHRKQTSKNIVDTTFKACVRYFYFFYFIYLLFFFTKWQPLNNYEKCFLFHLKSSFHCQDIQIFVFPSSPLFVPVSHWLRGWWKINLKVYDVSNCLNKNLITHFV